MRKIVIVVLSVWTAVAGAAGPQDVLRQLAARMDALGDYHAEFEIVAEDGVRTGTYSVSGDRYRMYTDGYEVVSDGRTRWEFNHIDREVSVDDVDSGAGNLFNNPTRAFEFAPEAFDGSMTQDGVLLVPRDKSTSVSSIELRISPATGLPAELKYRQEGVRGEIVVRILKLQKGLPEGVEFIIDKKKYGDYEILDFR